VLQEQPAKALDRRLQHRVCFVLHFSAKLIELLIHQLHDVKSIKHQFRIGQVLLDGREAGTGHVRRNRLDLRP
jgi:hypothetical protein